MALSFKKFASFLVIQYSKLNCINPDLLKQLGDFMNDKTVGEIIKSLDLLSHHYKSFIDEINIKKFEEYAWDMSLQKSEYVQYLISRCLKLSPMGAGFFEFLLVCLYICKMAEGVFARYKCCKILKFTADSLEAVYYRVYYNYFEKNGGFLGLSKFCRDLNACPPSIRYRGDDVMTLFSVIDFWRNENVSNFKCLNDVDDKVELTTEEKNKLVDKPYFVANNRSEDYLLDWGLKEDKVVNEIKESWDVVTEKVYKTGIRCDYCRSKCFQYLENLSQNV